MKLPTLFNLFVLISLIPTLAWSANCGGDCSGGGSTICSAGKSGGQCTELMDMSMAHNRFDLLHSEVYRTEVQPVLKKLEAELPDFAAELEAGLTEKKWYFTDAKLPKLGASVNGTDLATNQVAVQFQSSKEIWMDGKWFHSRPAKEQAAIIFHELGVGMYLKQKGVKADQWLRDNPDSTKEQYFRSDSDDIAMSDVRQLTELLVGKIPAAETLQKNVYDLNFGTYLTGPTKTRFQAYQQKLYGDIAEACHKPDEGSDDQSPRRLAVGKVLAPLVQAHDKALAAESDGVEQKFGRHAADIYYINLQLRFVSEARDFPLMNLGHNVLTLLQNANHESYVRREPLTYFGVPQQNADGTWGPSTSYSSGKDYLDGLCDFASRKANPVVDDGTSLIDPDVGNAGEKPAL